MKRLIYLIAFLLSNSSIILAQGGPGMPGRQFDVAKMVAAEKQLLLDSVSGLNEDQKLIINQIYQDYETAFNEGRKSMDPDNRESMREQMMKIRDEKTEALKAILTENQFNTFQAILEKRREQARNRRRNNE